MKIVFITNGLFPVPATKGGGAETLVQNILDQNEIYHKAEFIVYSVYDEKAIELASHYKYSEYRFICKKIWNIKDTCYLAKHFYYKKILGYTIYRCIYDFDIVLDELQHEQFDYIVIENTLVPFEKFIERYGNKVFVHIHNELFKQTYPLRQRIHYGDLINRSAGVITVSNYIKEFSLNMGYATPDKFHVLLNSVDIQKYKQEIDIRKDLSDKKYIEIANTFTFVYCGRVCREKGVLELVNAFKRIDNLDIRMMIIGNVDEKSDDTYIKNVKKIVDTDFRIVTMGYVDHDEIWKFLRISDCAVLPSKCQDACPLTVIESMAAKLPIISTKTGGVPEEVDQNCSILLDNNENLEENLYKTMDKIIKEKSMLSSMAEASDLRTPIGGFFDLNSYYERFIKIIEGKE